jgi:endonuclease-3
MRWGLESNSFIRDMFTLLRKYTKGVIRPAAETIVVRYGCDPFLILVSCILSLRTKDTVSYPASIRLFEHAKTIDDIINLDKDIIEKAIYPVGFYRRKTEQIKSIAQKLKNDFNGEVPNDRGLLLSLPGVGRKTANLVLGMGFGVPAICVDVHVHRISNNCGIVTTKTTEETEYALEKIIPKDLWVEYNALLVMWGQNICTSRKGDCNNCPLFLFCRERGII